LNDLSINLSVLSSCLFTNDTELQGIRAKSAALNLNPVVLTLVLCHCVQKHGKSFFRDQVRRTPLPIFAITASEM